VSPFAADAARRASSTIDRFGPFLLGHPLKTRDTLLAVHLKARKVIRGGRGTFPVGVTLAMFDFQAVEGGEAQRDRARSESYDVFLEEAQQDEFVGVQTYSRQRFGPDGPIGPEPGVETLIMGYEYWPDALEETVRYARARANVPIYVTENGIGTTDDAQRIEYVRRALSGVVRCLRDGLDVRGYFYWSLLDNFEWLFGYGPQFGLVGVDRRTQLRTPKPSAYWLGGIARANAFETE